MPSRLVLAKELADMFKVLAHPDRIRLIEELRRSEKDVNTIASDMDLPATRVSQHLALLRAHRMVTERREGRHHLYTLTRPEIAGWIVDALDFVDRSPANVNRQNINDARRLWADEGSGSASS